MDRILERLGDDAILHGEILVTIAADALIDRPGAREMVEDYIFGIIDREGIRFGIGNISQAYAKKAHDDIGGIDNQRVVRNTYTVSGCRLSVNSDTACFDTQFAIEMDCSRCSKENAPCAGL